ncbi:hypothetical protein O3P69_013388 [Scylla paramamosain]|uniref:Uncharacterized protein n=1 Tax=Scylla paramamosain TaxID=85552 RepID=A0AAW0U1Z0_SCYPA
MTSADPCVALVCERHRPGPREVTGEMTRMPPPVQPRLEWQDTIVWENTIFYLPARGRTAERPRACDRRLVLPERQRVGVAREAGGGGARVDTTTFPTILTRLASSHPPLSAAPGRDAHLPPSFGPFLASRHGRLSVDRIQCPRNPGLHCPARNRCLCV